MELPLRDNMSIDDRWHTIADPSRDALYNYDPEMHRVACNARPWKSDPKHFTTARISAAALLKMAMHARSGGNIEVMGLMQGYVDGRAIVVTDAFRLPVEGTETRVNAQDDANEYMVEYSRLCREGGALLDSHAVGASPRGENVVGWYHSHPGYGCWLSGIDVATQAMQQKFNEPFMAVVVDPDRTISDRKVEIGAFRTFPDDHKPEGDVSSGGGGSDMQAVPLHKAEDFGAHASRYYPLEVEHFQSSLDAKLLDALWAKYWVQTLAPQPDPRLANREYDTLHLKDLSGRLRMTQGVLARAVPRANAGGAVAIPILGGATANVGVGGGSSGSGTNKALELGLERAVREVKELATKEKTSLMSSQIKTEIFKD